MLCNSMSHSKKIYSLSGIPGVGKTTRGREMERRGAKFYPEPTHEWPLEEFYAVKGRFEAGEASKEEMMDATNYLQLRIGISYLNLGRQIIAFSAANPDVDIIVERSPFDTTLFLRANTIPDNLRPMQIKQYEALKDFMSTYNNIAPWDNVHHIFLVCTIDETVSRLLSRGEDRISPAYLQQLHDVHSAAFPEIDNIKTSTCVGEKALYDIIDVTKTGVVETCALIADILNRERSPARSPGIQRLAWGNRVDQSARSGSSDSYGELTALEEEELARMLASVTRNVLDSTDGVEVTDCIELRALSTPASDAAVLSDDA